jgi:uncharacterized oxidoreductase
MKLTENTILITGGGSGIGKGLAKAFASLHNQVVVAGRNEERLKSLAEGNDKIEYAAFDVSCAQSVSEFSARITEKYPNLNVLINNAGIMQAEDVKNHNLDTAEMTLAVNLLGPIRLTAALLPLLQRQEAATVMNVTSGLAFVPKPFHPTYSATKAALHSYSISLRQQLSDTSVEVIELAPPYVQTALTGKAQERDPQAMPLDDFISETMALIKENPNAQEILVNNVRPLRNAEKNGEFDKVFENLTRISIEQTAKENAEKRA